MEKVATRRRKTGVGYITMLEDHDKEIQPLKDTSPYYTQPIFRFILEGRERLKSAFVVLVLVVAVVVISTDQ